MMSRPPLHLRVPNPAPGVRAPEESALAEHLRTHRVTRVIARGGSASQLVFKVLEEEFSEARDHAIYVDLKGAHDRKLAPGLRAMAAVAAIEQEGVLLHGEGMEACAALIDLADELGRAVVVDGISAADEEWLAAIDAAVRYARSARWIFIEEEGSADGDASNLFVAPSTVEMTGRTEEASPAETRLLDAISIVRSVPWSAVPPELRELGARLVQRNAISEEEGYWVVPRREVEPEMALEAAELLAQFDDPGAHLAAAEIFSRQGREHRLTRRLIAARDDLIARGFGVRLWELLDQLGDERARRAQLAIAARLKAPRVGANTRPVDNPRAVDRFHYAQLLLDRSRSSEAATQVRKALESGDGTAERDELHLFLAQCCLARSAPGEARTVLKQIVTDDPVTLFRRDVLLLGTDIVDGVSRDLDARLDELLDRLPDQQGEHSAAGRLDLVRALHLTGRIRDALQLLEARPNSVGRHFYTLASHAYMSALVFHSAGRLADAQEICERLLRSTDRSSMLGKHVVLLLGAVLRERGDLDAAEELLLELVEDASQSEYREIHAAARLALANTRLERDGIDSWTDFEIEGVGGRYAGYIAAAQTGIDLRRGDLAPDDLPSDANLDCRFLAAVLGGEPSLDGELAAAHAQAQAGGDFLKSARYARDRALAAVVSGDDAAEALGRWREEAAAIGRASQLALAELLIAVWQKSLSLSELIRLRGSGEVGHLASEIALPEHSSDRLMRLLAEACRTRLGWSMDTRGDGAPWWIDVDEQTVHVDDQTISLASSAIRWSLVAALVEHDLKATKEQLIAAVWGIDDHHPLEDENRLRMAVYKLRRQLGDEGAAFIRTTDEGYALGARPCIVRRG